MSKASAPTHDSDGVPFPVRSKDAAIVARVEDPRDGQCCANVYYRCTRVARVTERVEHEGPAYLAGFCRQHSTEASRVREKLRKKQETERRVRAWAAGRRALERGAYTLVRALVGNPDEVASLLDLRDRIHAHEKSKPEGAR